jgi:hypothetical protein
MATDACVECGFDSDLWADQQDIERTLLHVDHFIEAALEGIVEPARSDVLMATSTPTSAVIESDGDLEHVHALFHRLAAIARERTRFEDVSPMVGSVVGLFSGDGGVPKHPIDAARVDRAGVVGDVQASRVHHGRPWQALCIYSADVVDALRSEGHPIRPGSAGENVSVAGIDWSLLRAGLIVELGEVRCRLSAAATPCSKNNQWFADDSSSRIAHDLHPGWSRWYVSVLDGGIIRAGDRVVVRADDPADDRSEGPTGERPDEPTG